MQGTAIPNLDMGAASIKMNDDGSFNLLVGATDLGTGSDTVLTQMAAEVLGCPPEDFITYSSDTDFTPFDKGAYASSTTYISGAAVVEAARKVAEQIKAVAGRMLDVPAEEIMLAERQAWANDGRSVTLAQVALESLHHSQPAPDHGRRLLRQPRQPAALRRAVRRGDGGHRDRAGDGEEAGDGAGLRHDRQPGHGGGPDRGRHDPGAGLCRVRGDALRCDGPDGQPALRRLPHLRRRRDAGDGGALRADLRADAPVRGQGRGRDPAGRRRAGGGERGLQRHRRAGPGHPADAGAGVAGAAANAAVNRMKKKLALGEKEVPMKHRLSFLILVLLLLILMVSPGLMAGAGAAPPSRRCKPRRRLRRPRVLQHRRG